MYIEKRYRNPKFSKYSDPSGTIQSIQQTHFDEKESLHFNFTDLLPMEKRGNITHFNISVNKVENPWDTFNDTTRYFEVPSDAFEFSLLGLDNYTEYYITVAGYTAVGAGPVYNVTFRTATNSKFLFVSF